MILGGIEGTDENAKYTDIFEEQRAFYAKNNLDFSKMEKIKQECEEAGSVYMPPTIAYNMTEQEAQDTANKLRSLISRSEELFPKYKAYFDKSCSHADFQFFVEDIALDFEKSKGYRCI
jgi:hypothetical protein